VQSKRKYVLFDHKTKLPALGPICYVFLVSHR